MIIKKIFNNNAIVAKDGLREEFVVMGKGVGFKKSVGDSLDETLIEKLFVLQQNETSEKFKSLLEDIPSEYVSLCYDIIEYAKNRLKTPLSEYIYVTLTDHINNTIKLYDEGIKIVNPLAWEIKRIYPKEYDVGFKALDFIEETVGKRLPEDEAANIAQHLINPKVNSEYPNVADLGRQLEKINDILAIIQYTFRITLDEQSVSYERLLTHLKFFFQRLNKGREAIVEDDFLFRQVRSKYKKAYDCALKIEKYLNTELSDEEKLYLTIHIERITRKTTE
ncbi:BglG family transcription antiterminator LicT [Paenibacillus massiliensis]|uniref:BglG family transcription antiterminator LicT n=1 Tax=Paenibacillus massiliensis TaxID=225917 RepID=UPI00036A1991|nr:PRD domain-containing protein [Paenibacillus massiliensis]